MNLLCDIHGELLFGVPLGHGKGEWGVASLFSLFFFAVLVHIVSCLSPADCYTGSDRFVGWCGLQEDTSAATPLEVIESLAAARVWRHQILFQ